MRIVIIGHGPSMKNARLGRFIDAIDGYVVRLTNRSWQNPLNYGIRTDYILASSELKRLRLVFEESKANYETWVYAHRSKGLKELKKTVVKELQQDGFNPVICREEVIPWIQRYKDLYEEYREKTNPKERQRFLRHFSQGLAAVIIAAQRLDHVKELLLLGFDNLLLGTDKGFFSYACLALSGGKIFRSKREHNYAAERQILDEILAEYNIKLLTKENL